MSSGLKRPILSAQAARPGKDAPNGLGPERLKGPKSTMQIPDALRPGLVEPALAVDPSTRISGETTMPTHKAEAEWKGNLAQGSGRLKVGSGAFDGPYSFKSRFEEGQSATNPEELI